MCQPALRVVLASTRPGRIGKPVADWFVARAEEFGGFEVELIDLAEINLPFFDEPKHPRFGDYQHEHTRAWSSLISRSDAFVLVTPEYNHGFNAVLKNALDYLHLEWAFKPVGIVSYGGIAAGTRAAQMLNPVLSALKMVVVHESVNIPFAARLLNSNGVIESDAAMNDAADLMLEELWRVVVHLAPLRP